LDYYQRPRYGGAMNDPNFMLLGESWPDPPIDAEADFVLFAVFEDD
jgi:hypothetical protein